MIPFRFFAFWIVAGPACGTCGKLETFFMQLIEGFLQIIVLQIESIGIALSCVVSIGISRFVEPFAEHFSCKRYVSAD